MDKQQKEDPTKYSEAYFEDRIRNLQTKIKQSIPSIEDIDFNGLFTSVLYSLDAAKDTIESTKSVVTAIQEEQKKHSQDEDWKDPSLVNPSKLAVDRAQTTIDRLKEAGTNAGCTMIKTANFLGDDGLLLKIEDDLLECTVLIQATPKKLAAWCAESPEVNEPLLDRFLDRGNTETGTTMIARFLTAGGPSHGNYGMALTIYSKLEDEVRIMSRSESTCSGDVSLRQRLALAVALELATPIPIFHHDDQFVDPVERFRYFAKFDDDRCHCLKGNQTTDTDVLDRAFSTLSVWELRKVVDANATHADLDWGREFLRNYRPDQVWMEDPKWRYVVSVKTDVGYKHPDHDFNNYQELLSAGGECGPRAFFGRFMSKAWGIPTWGVRQPGHAAMTRWTDNRSIGGWTVCLGAGWPYSWWDDDRYGGTTRHGPDFLEESQARTAAICPKNYYSSIVLLECLAECLGETVEEDFVATKLWRSLALAQRKMVARGFSIPSPEDRLDEHSPLISRNPFVSQRVDQVWNRCDGTIVIPATAFVDPLKPSGNVMVMKSFLDGDQLHLERDGQVVYEFPDSIVTAGTYALSIMVVNVHRDQKPLVVHIEDPCITENRSFQYLEHPCTDDGYEIVHSPRGQEITVQYTNGKWEQTKSIRVALGPKCRFRLSRSTPCHGLSLKEIVLKPI